MKIRIKLLIAAVSVVIVSAVLTLLNSRVDIDYCKGVVKTGGGCAVLTETDRRASVIKLDENGNVTDRADMLLFDPFRQSVKSVHDMFTDDGGGVWFFCTEYSPDRAKRELLCKCDFSLGRTVCMRDLGVIDGYSPISGGVPYVDGGNIYIPMRSGDDTVDIILLSGNGYSVAAEDCLVGVVGVDRIYYRRNTVYYEDTLNGIFADGQRIYPSEEKIGDKIGGMCTGLTYDNGYLCFVDAADGSAVRCELSTGNIAKMYEGLPKVDALQRIAVYSDGTVTAAREDGEDLRAYRFGSGAEKIYTAVNGGFSWLSFAVKTALCAIAAAVLTLLYTLLFVRLKKRKETGRRYQSIASRITAISTAAGIVCAAVFGAVISGTVRQLNNGLRSSVNTGSSQFYTSYIMTNCRLEFRNGLPVLDEKSAAEFSRISEEYTSALAENSGIECGVMLMVRYNGRLYELRGCPCEAAPAELEVSLRSFGLINGCIDDGANRVFTDKMTSGMYRYTCSNSELLDKDNNEYRAVIVTATDCHRLRQTGFMLYLWLIAIVLGSVILVLAAANIVLRLHLKGLKRLKNAFGLYENGGEPEVFEMSGGDEIAQTGQALMLMTEGTRVRTRDISEGNRRYKRFMSAGILKLMGRSEISKVTFGERVRVECLIMRLILKRGEDMSEQVRLLNLFLEESGGILLDCGGGKADVCFTRDTEFGAAADMAARSGFPSAVLITFGAVEAGSAGSDSGAWLVGLSREFSELERLSKLLGDEKRTVCTKKAAEKLKDADFLSHCELRVESAGELEYFEVIPRGRGGDEHKTADNNSHSGSGADNSLDTVV